MGIKNIRFAFQSLFRTKLEKSNEKFGIQFGLSGFLDGLLLYVDLDFWELEKVSTVRDN